MSSPQHPKGKVPLERAFSKLGIATRTRAREWIRAGKVTVNGKLCKTPFYLVSPEKDRIMLEGKRIQKAKRVVFMLYKPRGFVTTHSDEKKRPTVFSLLSDYPEHLIAIGRLDQATSGLLLLTNDSRLADKLTDPANKVPRTYLVTVKGCFSAEKINVAKNGVKDKGETLRVDDINIRKTSNRESHLTVRLLEGKNREIRRIFLALGHEVTRLKRIAFGNLTLDIESPGKYREISERELQKAFPFFTTM